MEEQLITFETAKLAKEKGFDIPCTYGYYLLEEGHKWNGKFRNFSDVYTILPKFKNSEIHSDCTAPTQSLLQKWLREVHNFDLWFGQLNPPKRYHVEDIVLYDSERKCTFLIGGVDEGSKTYEEALEIGLQEALKLIGVEHNYMNPELNEDLDYLFNDLD